VKIHSAAQLAMFTKAATDANYAKQRGISQELAQQHLDAHKANGNPDLPERATGTAKPVKRPTDGRPIFLQSMRNQ
jgi:hypothetical protein